jgi:hypothetical protein
MMTQLALPFAAYLVAESQSKPDPVPREQSELRCRDCIHFIRHRWNGSYFYCRNQKSRLTGCGFKKIKALDFICQQFKPSEK